MVGRLGLVVRVRLLSLCYAPKRAGARLYAAARLWFALGWDAFQAWDGYAGGRLALTNAERGCASSAGRCSALSPAAIVSYVSLGAMFGGGHARNSRN